MKAGALVMLLVVAGCAPASTDDYADLYKQLHPSIVFLSMKAPSDDPKMHGKIDDAYGSAFVVASGDWGTRMITAEHVIEDAQNLRAIFGDAARASDVRIVARDHDADLALLEVKTVKNATPVVFGDSAKLIPGQRIGVIGYPIPDAFQDEGSWDDGFDIRRSHRQHP